ncbi:hypothetical protein GpartN1_g5289.t1 [Galdieria partita]|uniref:Uncharacterized protein n=1 Tax=Galdieria partita TaxID=83374 RepID=A0A9C7PZ00_9RHOD|nr:hypothetical protein GpartN1_g5289.t1 [Galdieria partita]
MFYSTEILTKKGPLGRVWLAATIGKERIQKKFALDVSISSLCAEVLRPPNPYALRLSAQLMIGICRIFEKKCSIVFVSANDTIHQLSRLDSGIRKTTDTFSDPSTGQINLTKGTANLENITLTSRTMPYPPEIGRLLQSVENNIQFLGHENLLQSLLVDTRPDAILFEEELLNMTLGSSLESQRIAVLKEGPKNASDTDEPAKLPNSLVMDTEAYDIQRMRSFSFLQANPNDITLRTDDLDNSLDHSEISHLSMSCLLDDDLHQHLDMSIWSPPSERRLSEPELGRYSYISLHDNETRELFAQGELLMENNTQKSADEQEKFPMTIEKERIKKQSQFRQDIKTELTTRYLKACLNNTKDTIVPLHQERKQVLQTWLEEETILPLLIDFCDVTLLKPPPNIHFFHFESKLTDRSFTEKRKRYSEALSGSVMLPGDLQMSTDEPEMLRFDGTSATKRKKTSVSTAETFRTETRSYHSNLSIEDLVPETYLPAEEGYLVAPRTSFEEVGSVATLPLITEKPRATQEDASSDPLSLAAFNILQRDYFSQADAVSFQQIAKGGTRSSAAKIFYYLLVLKTFQQIHVEQEAPFGHIVIRPVQ